MVMIKRYLWILLSILFVTGCESLEETYSDYAGDGSIRYLGKCSDFEINPGWQRLILTWKNSVDPVISNVKITWRTADGTVSGDTLLDRLADSCSIPTPANGSYEVSLCNVDKNGNSSLVETLFARPYNYAHESIISFSRLITKHYFVKDRLIIYFGPWQDNIIEANLLYTKKDGTPGDFSLDENLMGWYGGSKLLSDEIDINKPVCLLRKGRLIGCPDIIEFAADTLSHTKLYSTDFKMWIQAKYNQSEFTNEFAETLEELEIDYSIRSLTDILNLPNLKKIILGKNRFLDPSTDIDDFWGSTRFSGLVDMQDSKDALEYLREIKGDNFNGVYYTRHFFDYTAFSEFMKAPLWFTHEKDIPTPLERSMIDTTGWEIICEGIDAAEGLKFSNLFDGRADTKWNPQNGSSARTYEIIVDMKQERKLGGVRIRQITSSDEIDRPLLPTTLKVHLSTDGVIWNNATCIAENQLGDNFGEITDIEFGKEAKNARYVKFVLYDHVYKNNMYAIALADIWLYGPQM